MTNVGIANNETLARQQDTAMRDSVRSQSNAALSANLQSYLKDKGSSKENEAYNKRIMSLLDTGEYKLEMGEDDEIKMTYVG